MPQTVVTSRPFDDVMTRLAFHRTLSFFFPPLQNGWVSANHVGTYQRWYIGMVTNFVIPNGCINFNFWIQLEICSFQQANLSPAARYALHCAANVRAHGGLGGCARQTLENLASEKTVLVDMSMI